MRIALIGAGGQARLHAAAMAAVENATLSLVVARHIERAQALADQYGARATDDAIAAAVDPDVEAIVIATPTATHPQIAEAALRAGKHVLCEAPMAETLAEADVMLDAADGSPGRLCAALIHRFDRENAHLRDLIRSHALGTVRMVMTQRLFSPPWRVPGVHAVETHYGDAIHELLFYDLDWFRWVFDAPVTVLAARGTGKEDYVSHVDAMLECAGVPIHSTASQLLPKGFPFTLRATVIGEEGAAFLRFCFPAGGPPEIDYRIERPDRPAECPSSGMYDPFTDQMARFVAVAEGAASSARLSPVAAREALSACLDVEAAVNRAR